MLYSRGVDLLILFIEEKRLDSRKPENLDVRSRKEHAKECI